jgi:hypothetical protein
MPLMKTVECPHCGNPFRVVAEAKEGVQADRLPDFIWLRSTCEKCFKPYDIWGDPRSTTTRAVPE